MTSFPRRREFWFAIIAILVALFVALVLAELVIRVTFPSPAFPSIDPVLGAKGNPGGDNDARGFRNISALDSADIVALGDSQTYGDNATKETTWTADLAAITGRSVYQMAFGGWAMPQYRALTRDALALKPKTVIVAFYAGNDLLDTVDATYHRAAFASYRDPAFVESTSTTESVDIRLALDHGTAPQSLGESIAALRVWLRSTIRVYALLGDGTRILREKLGLAETSDARTVRIGEFIDAHPELAYAFRDPKQGTILSPSYRFDAVNLTNPDTSEGWRITKAIVADIRANVESAGSRLALVLIPTKELVYLEWFEETGQKAPPDFVAYEKAERGLFAAWQDFCMTERLTCIPVLPNLVGALKSGNRPYVDDVDGHPFPAGYAAIAQGVADGLAKNGFLTAGAR